MVARRVVALDDGGGFGRALFVKRDFGHDRVSGGDGLGQAGGGGEQE